MEFGHKAQLVEGDDGVVVDHIVEQGNPADAPQLAARGRTGPHGEPADPRGPRPPTAATARRGVEYDLHQARGVRLRGHPTQGQDHPPNERAVEHRPAFRRTIKWRTGCEGRISTLKRGYGLDRTGIDGTEGARIWTGHGILAHNLIKISVLTA